MLSAPVYITACNPPLSWGLMTHFLLCSSLGLYLVLYIFGKFIPLLSARVPLQFLFVNNFFLTAIFDFFCVFFRYLATVIGTAYFT